MARKKLLLPLFILSASLILGACSPTTTPAPTNLETETPNVTLAGTIVQAGTRFSINVPGKPTVELDSRKINLGSYAGKTVIVPGQYSGTTLFIDKVE